MPENTHIELIETVAERVPEEARRAAPDPDQLRQRAEQVSTLLAWNPSVHESHFFSTRWAAMAAALRPALEKVARRERSESDPDDLRWLRDNLPLLWAELWNTRNAFKLLRRLPHVRTPKGITIPRAAALAEAYLHAVDFDFGETSFLTYLDAFQKSTVLKFRELWALLPAMELLLLDQVAIRARKHLDTSEASAVGICVRSLREINQLQWKDVLESQIAFDQVLRQDPAGAYPRMDFDSRSLYREKVVKIAERSDLTEMEVAREALALAQQAGERHMKDPRMAARESHIGYYLVSEGAAELRLKVGFRPSLAHKIRSFLKSHPDEFYLPGIEVLTLAIMSAIVLLLTSRFTSPGLILFSLLVLLLPCSQSAVQVMNYLTTALLRPEILPKLDFSKGIPAEATALVAVPALLLNEKQVRRLVEDLEVRYLANHDPNLHFVLLTDLPDSPVPSREDHPLVDLCADLIKELNEKYAEQQRGSFLMLHRHRVYNPREKVWMGWERKRGKLMDLNKLLTSNYDSFPVKAGDLGVLSEIRFVITLDADTELPRSSAHRLIGTLAHPLNQAVIDPEKNVVVAGYGILQPRVRVSVQSAARSRLANIYSGQTGFDIYTRAVSDVYQDLYGEGIFAGKGIYEVETVHRVLDRRFPQNALLSHDLIEGAYARAGLLTDTEVIEDYPSHYSAYNRRRHRWLRGDWQITSWLFSRVPDETGRLVPNPISLVSQWKIFDNLRRSLVEPATLLLFILGWLVLPGSAKGWTVATIAILFVPVYFEFLFTLVRSAAERKISVAREALASLVTANVSALLTLTFLPHQTLVSLDAVVRTLVRRLFTRQRLLEWETAAEAELGRAKRTPVDIYLNWMPVIALLLAIVVYWGHRSALASALPILVLWGCSKGVSLWLDNPPKPLRTEASDKDRLFLRRAAIRTWRYFAEFSNEEHNWLIPDNLQEEPYSVAARASPTNIGFLLNARQVACAFGYLTVAEFSELTAKTLATLRRMKRHRGHIYNWYDTRTLRPLPPLFVSSVDSGNLLASLWTLAQGCEYLVNAPIVGAELAHGFLDHLRILTDFRAFPRRLFAKLEQRSRTEDWLKTLLRFPASALERVATRDSGSKHQGDVKWFAQEAAHRLRQLRQTIVRFLPWLLEDFAALRSIPELELPPANVPLKELPAVLDALALRLQTSLDSEPLRSRGEESLALVRRLLSLVSGARMDSLRLIQELEALAADAERMAGQMEFGFLWNPRRKLLSIGFEATREEVHSACYDLLASEARIAVFVAIAKDDIPQETWFLLARTHTNDHGRPVLVSWTGTMFEYLMPALWIRTYDGTLLDRSRRASVSVQQEFTSRRRIPWGISESAYGRRDQAGNYQYQAFGIPQLALHQGDADTLVISPYSTFLALTTSAKRALENLRRMAHDGWFGSYGFYESADFTASRASRWRHHYELVRCWMAHHQGMTLLSIANFLADGIVQEWFHSQPRVQATELLLHEKPVNYVPSTSSIVA
ncbi:MAG: glycosyl transferase [Acidobacteria bacterium]|nr:glycosyl transferase [Acidobacteriota bacterium]